MSPPGRSYVDSPWLQVFPPPSLCQDVTQYLFFLRGRRSRLQALCDRFLNEPSGGAVDYRVRLPFVVLTFQSIGRLRSGAEGFKDWGYTSEREATFWVAVSDAKKHGAGELCERVELFVPFIYSDNPWAVAGGRELYGFPKQASTVHMPGQGRGAFEIHTLAYRSLGPDSQAQVARLLTVERADGAHLEPEALGWGPGDELLQRLSALKDELGQLLDFDFEIGARIVEFLLRPSVPMVFLKQFREVGSTTQACYQALVGAQADQIDLKSIRVLPRRFRLELDSRGQMSIPGALRVRYDFRLNEGHLIWSGTP